MLRGLSRSSMLFGAIRTTAIFADSSVVDYTALLAAVLRFARFSRGRFGFNFVSHLVTFSFNTPDDIARDSGQEPAYIADP